MCVLIKLKFCIQCKNRAFAPEYGVICSLTNSIAQFEKSCDSYLIDEDYIIKQEEKHKNISGKWKKWDSGFLDSKKSRLWLNIFEYTPEAIEVILMKKKYDYFTIACLIAYLYKVRIGYSPSYLFKSL